MILFFNIFTDKTDTKDLVELEALQDLRKTGRSSDEFHYLSESVKTQRKKNPSLCVDIMVSELHPLFSRKDCSRWQTER